MLNILVAVLVPALFFGAVATSVWYVDARLRRLLGYPSRRRIRAGCAVLLVALIGVINATATSANVFLSWLYLAGGYVFTFYVFLFLALLALHLLQLKWQLSGPSSAAMVFAVALAATLWGAVKANSFDVREQVIQVSGLEQPVAVMHVSDVHLGHHRGREYLQQIVDATNQRAPDLVVITGDLVDAEVAITAEVLAPLSKLAAPAYFVVGNHENYTNAPLTAQLVAQQGVHVLHNERVESHGLQLVGLDYMNADEDAVDLHPSADPRTIKATLQNLPLAPGIPSVLLHHSPVGAAYAEAAGFDLTLAGHTHAGQFFPNTLLAPLIFPFNHGLYRQGKLQVFVSAGAGTFLLRSRLGSSNEIVLLRLVPADSR
jgi:predicted MPP superfamily phosphohydrolase